MGHYLNADLFTIWQQDDQHQLKVWVDSHGAITPLLMHWSRDILEVCHVQAFLMIFLLSFEVYQFM